MDLSNIKRILTKRANGFFYCETVEEFLTGSAEGNQQSSIDEIPAPDESVVIKRKRGRPKKSEQQAVGLLRLVKKKVTKHYVEPDLVAVKMLIELFDNPKKHDSMSYEELQKRREQLLSEVTRIVKEDMKKEKKHD